LGGQIIFPEALRQKPAEISAKNRFGGGGGLCSRCGEYKRCPLGKSLPFSRALSGDFTPTYGRNTLTSVVEVNLNLPPGDGCRRQLYHDSCPHDAVCSQTLSRRYLVAGANHLFSRKNRFYTGGFGRPCKTIGSAVKWRLLTEYASDLEGEDAHGFV